MATPIVEKLKRFYPNSEIDFLLRKGNEGLLQGNPNIHAIIVWDKKNGKLRNLLKLTSRIRSINYDLVVNLQRFLSSGILAGFSRGKEVIGFKKNPLSFMFHRRLVHEIGNGEHEVDRNLQLITHLTDDSRESPMLYLKTEHFVKVRHYQKGNYLVLAPTSVWFTKQFPAHLWVKFLNNLNWDGMIYLIGAPSDFTACQHIIETTINKNVINLCGQLDLLESVALMKGAKMNFVNDSAPQHFASAVNAPTTTIFCSTVPDFGFGPLSEGSQVIQVEKQLPCRPCGLHGHKSCPEGHFKCAEEIDIKDLIQSVPSSV